VKPHLGSVSTAHPARVALFVVLPPLLLSLDQSYGLLSPLSEGPQCMDSASVP
jgi:hypothetical protein